MKKHIWLILCTLLICSCTPSEDQKAARLLSQIKTLYKDGCYTEALDSIMALRMQFPKAIESRKEALRIWQNASLKQAQADIAQTDSALQTVLRSIPLESNLYKANMMRVERDSLKARYEAMCGVVRMIRMRQKQGL
jgi:hypothetical protein